MNRAVLALSSLLLLSCGSRTDSTYFHGGQHNQTLQPSAGAGGSSGGSSSSSAGRPNVAGASGMGGSGPITGINEYIGGVYTVRAVGERVRCSSPPMAVFVDSLIELNIDQDEKFLAKGFVSISGLHQALEGLRMEAFFTRSRFEVVFNRPLDPVQCLSELTVEATFDFDTATGRAVVFEAQPLACPGSKEFCKGNVTVELSLP